MLIGTAVLLLSAPAGAGAASAVAEPLDAAEASGASCRAAGFTIFARRRVPCRSARRVLRQLARNGSVSGRRGTLNGRRGRWSCTSKLDRAGNGVCRFSARGVVRGRFRFRL